MKTESELVFEKFLDENTLTFQKIDEETTRRPDYLVQIGDGVDLVFEVKELAEDKDFATTGSRTIGDDIRRIINKARGQVRYASTQGIPAILLVYNKMDPLFQFGTEDHDFKTAMYGELTLTLDRRTASIVDAFYGRNQSMREERNTEFSAVGRLQSCSGKMTVTLFENVFAQVRIPYEKLPACLVVRRVNIERTGPLSNG